jgi:hypothetical protein
MAFVKMNILFYPYQIIQNLCLYSYAMPNKNEKESYKERGRHVIGLCAPA